VTTTVTTTVWVVNGVHDNTTDTWALTQVTRTTSLTDLDVLVLFVTDDTDSRGAVQVDQANLTGGEADLSVVTFLSHQLRAVASRTHHLGATAGLQFDSVDGGTHWDVADRQAVTAFNRSFFVSDQLLADSHVLGSQDVVVRTVSFLDASDAGTAVWVVFDVLDNAFTLEVEVNQAVVLASATALVTGRNATLVVATVTAALGDQQ
jgi:hypothetical protein